MILYSMRSGAAKLQEWTVATKQHFQYF